ncbi:MAG: 4'-phosphopantetheinyl transferase family protein [Acetatifactor sp.]
MWETGYLLDLSSLPGERELLTSMEQYLDENRRKRLKETKSSKVFRQSLGAGLLLQKALQDYCAGRYEAKRENGSWASAPQDGGMLVEKLKEEAPLNIRLRFGEQGKPYLVDYPLFFSLSHSGDACLCVVSEQEIGADIQKFSHTNAERISRRFFTEEEILCLNACETQEEKQELFFRLWCRKEAYAKYTGQGVVKLLWQDASAALPGMENNLKWEEYTVTLADMRYAIAICRESEMRK